MDTVLQALLSWQFVLFCLALAAVVWVTRKIVEYGIDNWTIFSKESKLWKELVLPILPVFLGPLAAYLAKEYPFPDGITSVSARVAFGLVAGLLSGLLYRVIKASVSTKVNAVVSSVTGTPDAPVDPGAAVRDTINKQ